MKRKQRKKPPTLRELLSSFPDGLVGLQEAAGVSKGSVMRAARADGVNLPWSLFAKFAEAFRKAGKPQVTQYRLAALWLGEQESW